MTIIIGNEAGILVWYKRNDGNGEIAAIHTLPASWGSGLGHALLTEGIRQMRNAGIYSIYLWAFKENTRARRFYEKHGFHWTFQERESEFDGAIELLYELNLNE